MQNKRTAIIMTLEAVLIVALSVALISRSANKTIIEEQPQVLQPVEETPTPTIVVKADSNIIASTVTPIPSPTEEPTFTETPTEALLVIEAERDVTVTPTPSPTPTPVPIEENEFFKDKEKPTKAEEDGSVELADQGAVTERNKKYTENPDRTYPIYEVRESYGTYMLEPIYQDFTYDMCVKYEIEQYYDLMIALMWHESNFNIKEISKTNDYGLCQINKCNHSWLKKTLDIDPDFLNPYTSIECGTYMLSTYLKKYQDVHTALVAYNKGENAVSKNKTYETSYSRTVVNIRDKKLKEVQMGDTNSSDDDINDENSDE